jgi:hypothetical protein
MAAAETEPGNWGERWSAEEVGLLRSILGLSKASFAERLEVHRRTTRRWEQGATAAIDYRVIAALDDLLCETVCETAPWLTPVQVRHMDRHTVLRMLAGGAFVPLGGVGLFANGAPRRIGANDLNHLEVVSAGLANMYSTIPSEALINPVAAHLEDATRLLRESMTWNQRLRLHTIIGDLGVFLGYLSFNGDRPAQARAYLSTAEDHANEANDPKLLARVLVATSWTYSNVTTGGQREPSQEALTRLQRADHLAKHASPILKTLVTAHLAEELAVAKKPYESDEAFARSQEAFAVAERAEPARHQPCAVADYHSLSNGEGLDGYQGARQILLGRGTHATETLVSALKRTQAPRRKAIILADLAEALSQQDEPDESCSRLGQAHAFCQDHHYPLGSQRIFGIRERFPKHFANLGCVRQLDELLGRG